MAARKKAQAIAPELGAVLAAPRSLEARRTLAAARTTAGDPHGEHIALSCDLVEARGAATRALRRRAAALYQAHRDAWHAEWALDGFSSLRLFGGLPAEVVIGKGPALPRLGPVLEASPITQATFHDTALGAIQKTLAQPFAERLDTLAFRLAATASPEAWAALFRPLPALRTLRFFHTSLRGEPLARVLAGLAGLTTLSGAFDAEVLANWPHRRGLQHLAAPTLRPAALERAELAITRLGAATFEDDGVTTLPPLTALRVTHGLAASAALWERLPALAELGLPTMGEYPDALRELLVSAPIWEQLDLLDLGCGTATTEHLSHAVLPRCQRLTRLRVRHAPSLAAAIAKLPALTELTVDSRELRGSTPCRLDDASLKALADAIPPTLRRLELHGTFGVEGVRALLGCTGLEEVHLGSARFDRAAVEALLALPSLSRIETLNCDASVAPGIDTAGVYLGPPPDVIGPQRAPIFSHEP